MLVKLTRSKVIRFRIIMTKENIIDILDKANEVIATVEDKVHEAAHATSEKATELKEDVVAAAHVAEEKATETAHHIQGELVLLTKTLHNKIIVLDKAAELKHNVEGRSLYFFCFDFFFIRDLLRQSC